MKSLIKVITVTTAFLIMSSNAWAKPKIDVQVKSEKEIVEMVDGVEVKKRVAADTIAPGNILYFVLNYANKGSEKATNVVFNNPIPLGTEYVTGSAKGAGSNVSYSADRGKTFNVPQQLTYAETTASGKTVSKKIPAAKYSHVRWLLTEVPAGASGQLEFQVQVK